MASPAPRNRLGRTWKDSLTSELGYLGMVCLGIFLYFMLALISLSETGTVGKVSPIQPAVQNNAYLSSLLEILGINRASPGQLQFFFFLILLLLFADFAWAILIFSRRYNKGLGSILWFAIGISLVLFLTPPLISKDIFSYIYYGKIGTVYHSNPYVVAPQKFASDPLLTYVCLNWKNTAVVYGPLFTSLSMLLTLCAGSSIIANIYAYKAAMILFNLANILLIWYLLGQLAPRRQRLGTILYAWNPLVLIHVPGGGHNDAMMMTFALVALALLIRERRYAGYVFLCLSVMVKFATIILVLAYVIYELSRVASWKRRARELAVFASILLIITVVLMLPFWDGPATLDSMRQNLGLHNYSSPGGLLTALAPLLLQHVFRLPADLARTLGDVLCKLLLYAVFLAFLLHASLKCASTRDLPHCFFAITAVFLLISSSYQPWYMVWLLPWLALRAWDRLSQTALFLGTGTTLFAGIRPY